MDDEILAIITSIKCCLQKNVKRSWDLMCFLLNMEENLVLWEKSGLKPVKLDSASEEEIREVLLEFLKHPINRGDSLETHFKSIKNPKWISQQNAKSANEASSEEKTEEIRQKTGGMEIEERELLLFVPIVTVQAKTPEHSRIIANSFDKTTYLDSGGSLGELKKRISLYAAEWTDGCDFYAPYTAIINASMTGKSRMLVEFRKLGVFLFILCLRPENHPNLRPARTDVVARWIESATNDDPLVFLEKCCCFHLHSMKALLLWLQHQEINGETKHLSLCELADLWYEKLKSPTSDEFWTSIMSSIEAEPRIDIKSMKPFEAS